MKRFNSVARIAVLAGLITSFGGVLLAAGPQITGYQIDGNALELAPASVTETEQGLRADIGWSDTTYPPTGMQAHANARGVTSLRVFITPNSGGFITFRYRFRTNGSMGYQGWTRYTDVGSNHFRAKVVYGFQGWDVPHSYGWEYDSVREAFWRWQDGLPWPEYGAPYDTNWMETSVYVHPGSGVELWLSVGSWGGTAAWVEIENLTALCTATAAPSAGTTATAATEQAIPPSRETIYVTVPGADQDARQPHTSQFRKRSVTSQQVTLASVASPCKGCCVSGLTPIDPADADSVTMEAGYDAWFWLSRCTTEIQEATPCFRDQVTGAGGTFRLSNTLRTAWYQRHFREVWDKEKALHENQDAECAALKQQVKQEKSKHLLGYPPAGAVNPRHVIGEAIDVSKHHGLTDEELLELAGNCNLYRRVAKDLFHFEYQQP